MAEESSRAWKDQYMLRLPDGMRDRIKRAAEANNRSMNAEIVATLEKEYPDVPVGYDLIGMVTYITAGATVDERMKRLEVVNGNLSASGKSGIIVQLKPIAKDVKSFAVSILTIDRPDD